MRAAIPDVGLVGFFLYDRLIYGMLHQVGRRSGSVLHDGALQGRSLASPKGWYFAEGTSWPVPLVARPSQLQRCATPVYSKQPLNAAAQRVVVYVPIAVTV
eukprot:9494133-Pyramimonas_sp.AAC.1